MNEQEMRAIWERGQKTQLVKEFGDLLHKYLIEDVESLEYVYFDEYHEEYVNITFEGGNSKTVNVSCDSFASIIRDVMKALS